jgi:hypothetical protein
MSDKSKKQVKHQKQCKHCDENKHQGPKEIPKKDLGQIHGGANIVQGDETKNPIDKKY